MNTFSEQLADAIDAMHEAKMHVRARQNLCPRCDFRGHAHCRGCELALIAAEDALLEAEYKIRELRHERENQ